MALQLAILPLILVWFGRYLVIKFILLLGVGVTTFWAYVTVMDNLEAAVIAGWGGLPADALAYLTIAGFTDGFGIILAALSIRAAIVFAPKLGLIYSAGTP